MTFYGKKYLIVSQYERNGAQFLCCVEKPGTQVVTFPAAITDFSEQPEQTALNLDVKSHFTIPGLEEVGFILDNALELST